MLYEFHLVATLGQMDGLACEVDGRTQQLVLHLIGCRHLVPVLWETLHQHAALLEDGVSKQEAAFHVFVRADADGHYVDLSRVEEHETRVEVLVDQHLQFDATLFAEIAQELIFKARWRCLFRVVIDDFTIGHSNQSSVFEHMLHHRQGVANLRLILFDFGFVVA